MQHRIVYKITEDIVLDSDDVEQAEFFAKEYFEDIGQPYEIIAIEPIE